MTTTQHLTNTHKRDYNDNRKNERETNTMTDKTRFVINRLIDELNNIWFTDDELIKFFYDLGESISLQTLTKYIDLDREITYDPIYWFVSQEEAKSNPHIVHDPCGNYQYKRTTYFINGLRSRV